jgi:hypothetical protein
MHSLFNKPLRISNEKKKSTHTLVLVVMNYALCANKFHATARDIFEQAEDLTTCLSLQANVRIIPQIRQQQLSSTHFILYSLPC